MSWLTTVFTDFQIGLMAFPLLLVLVALRLPLAASMFIVGINPNKFSGELAFS